MEKYFQETKRQESSLDAKIGVYNLMRSRMFCKVSPTPNMIHKTEKEKYELRVGKPSRYRLHWVIHADISSTMMAGTDDPISRSVRAIDKACDC